MNTVQLHCFMTVAETLNFARAAEQLNITQPSVSHQINSLEAELGVKLFRRTTRTVELTQEGRIFLNDAKNILSISQQAVDRFKSPVAEDRQDFVIGCHDSSELYIFPDVLREMKQNHPNLNPQFRVIPFQHLHQYLAEENIDVVVAFQKYSATRNNEKYIELMKIPAVCVMPASHPLAEAECLSADDLHDERMILFEHQKCADEIGRVQAQLMGTKSTSDFYFCDSFDAALNMVRAEFGIAVLPKLPILNSIDLCIVPLEGFTPLSYGIYYKEPIRKPTIKQFLKVANNLIKAN